VSAINPALEQHPDLVNQDPFGDGWFVRVKVKDKKDFDALMDRPAYQAMIGK
jgi:glycine cleavage system H protein